jgi:pyruvate,water dikinase
MAAQTIMWLDEISADQREVVGGKAANLASLLRAGFHTPPGFCVTTVAYRAFVEGNDLQEGIDALARDVDSTTAPYALFACPMDRALEQQILAACRQLLDTLPPGSRVAVRSSATTEDMPDASFAGQGETYLNVGVDELLDRIRDCWASLWTGDLVSAAQRRRTNRP